jgi:hypothetical protein
VAKKIEKKRLLDGKIEMPLGFSYTAEDSHANSKSLQLPVAA